jgi:hypothetical protein
VKTLRGRGFAAYLSKGKDMTPKRPDTRRRFLTSATAGLAIGSLANEAEAQSTSEFPKKLLKDIAASLLNNTTADPDHERVLIRYTRGTGQLSNDRVYIALQMLMYGLDGTPDGYHEGVWQALFTSPAQLLAVPIQPSDPLTVPVGPVQSPSPLANTKAHWTFGDGSRLYAEGPALSHLVPYASGASHFSVACSQVLTLGGTGWFENAHGLKQSLGATAVPAGVNFFDLSQPAPSFAATTIDTFRIIWPAGVPKGFDLDYTW